MTRTACGERRVLGVDGNSYDATCSKAAGHAGHHGVEFTTGRADEFLVAEWDEASVYFSLRRAWDRTRQDRRRKVYDLVDLPQYMATAPVRTMTLFGTGMTGCAGCIAGRGSDRGRGRQP